MIPVYLRLAAYDAFDWLACATAFACAWVDPHNWSDMFYGITEATQMDVSEFIRTWEALG